MEITEIVDRILRVHWKLIAVLLVTGLVVGFGIHGTDRRTYTAAARVLLDRPEPNEAGEAKVIADTAGAIITSPTVVERALADADVNRSAIEMVRKQRISVETVGSSGIVELSVTDHDPKAAAELANLLAEELIATRAETSRGSLEEALAGIQARIAQLGARARLTEDNGPLIEQLVVLEEKRADLLAQQSERPTAQIIDSAREPLRPDASRLPADLALGGLVGLLLGVGLSVILESFRPTVVGGPAVSRELETPVLGLLTTPPDRSEPDEIAPVATWLSTAAESAGVRTVALMSTSRRDGLEILAADLSKYTNGANPVDIRAMGLPVRGNSGRHRTASTSAAIVVVTPVVARRSDLIAVRDLFGMTGRRLLGAITYRDSRVKKIFRLTGRLFFGAGTDRGPEPMRSPRRRKVSNR